MGILPQQKLNNSPKQAAGIQPRKILFLDKVLIRGKKGTAVNGAERFNLQLLGYLQEHQIETTIVAAHTWSNDISQLCSRGGLKHISLPHLFKVAWPNSLFTYLLLRTKIPQHNALIIGNVGKNILPLLRLQRKRAVFPKTLLLAHREASPFFLRMLRGLDLTIVAVNTKIAQGFLDAGFSDTHVYFGEIRREFFSPAQEFRSDPDTFNYCVFGNLDPEWKGSDIATRAFGLLPEEVRSRAKLHLAGFQWDLPRFADPRIIAYPWLPENKTPSFLQEMDAVIVPSRDTGIMKETFSQASVQAMLTGLPMIVSSLPILKEKVADGGGLVFSDEQELAQHMSTLFYDAPLRKQLGRESVASARKNFLWDTEHFIDSYLFPTI